MTGEAEGKRAQVKILATCPDGIRAGENFLVFDTEPRFIHVRAALDMPVFWPCLANMILFAGVKGSPRVNRPRTTRPNDGLLHRAIQTDAVTWPQGRQLCELKGSSDVSAQPV